MSIHAGSILHVGGRNVIDRIQSAGLGDVRIQNDIIREVGNREVIDKVPQDPDFTFTLESLDVSTELEAWLTGDPGQAGGGSAAAPGFDDPEGTEYDWLDCGYVNITSPWKDATTGSAGVVAGGHIVPGYYPTRIRYRFGVTDNATQEVELAGGSYYYADGAPIEQFETGDGSTTGFATDEDALGHREGGEQGTSFRRVFGVMVDGVLQTRGIDFTETGGANDASADTVTVEFTEAPANGADIRFTYFTDAEQAWPQSVHASTIVKPGAVRGRNICVYIGSAGAWTRLGGVQAVELEATIDGELEREFCNDEPVGRTINGSDTTGTLTVRAKDKDAFFTMLETFTGVDKAEVFGFLNLTDVQLAIEIQNPKNPAQVLKTLLVDDTIFQIPGTPARVNSPTDFACGWESRSGTYKAVKGPVATA